MTRAIAIVVLFAATACAGKPAEVEKCEALLLPTLKAPSTYRLISNTVGPPAQDGSRDVAIEYDAVNSYNAPIRSAFRCSIDGKGAVRSRQDEVEAIADDLQAKAAAAADTRPASPRASPDHDDDVPVCDRPDSPEKRAAMNEIGVNCVAD